MLQFNFTRLLRARGINHPTTYLVKHGFSDKFATRVVRNDFRRFNLSDMERLCEVFLCTPDELLEWVPSGGIDDQASHPLFSLKRDEKVMDLTRVLNSVPLDKLLEIEKLIEAELKK